MWRQENYALLVGLQTGAATLSRGERPLPPCLHRLLLLFWAHYIDSFTLHRFTLVTENKGEGVANYIKEEGYLQI